MKGIVIGSDKSGGGKTTLTMGIMKALDNRGYKIQGYKVGPDYIDPEFHRLIIGRDSRNLDIHLMGEEGVRASFSRAKGDMAIIEGVMGFYDGMGTSTHCSTAHVARLINLPVVLVLSPQAQMSTLFAQIKGILAYEDNNIIGVILNNISASYYEKLKVGIEQECGLKVFGYLPKDPQVEIASQNLEVDYLAGKVEKHIDMEELIDSMGQTLTYKDSFRLKKQNLNIGIAKDEAFNFYYKENLELLEEIGEVTYFSPLRDKKLPDNLDFLYIGGGYIEEYAKGLSANQSLLKDIREKLEQGLSCYAEAAGLMYLTEGTKENPMVGFFQGQYYLSQRLQNFGYARATVVEDNPVLPLGLTINTQEFHRSYVTLQDPPIYSLKKDLHDGSEKVWTCGYQKKNTIASYGCTHFFGNMEMLNHLLKQNKKG